MKRVYDGLTILLKYSPDGDMYAAHDTIYASSVLPSEMTEEDFETLKANGWFWSDEYDCWQKFV